jgi:hypothetical protein
MRSMKYWFALGVVLFAASPAAADLVPFYVGRDTAAGTNQGHLTLLFNHGNHFHRLGTFGGVEGRIPEAYLGDHAIWMVEGSGAFAGSWVTTPYEATPTDPSGEYSDLAFRSVNTLLGHGPDDPETILANGGLRYFGDLSGVRLGIELLSLVGDVRLADLAGNTLLGDVGDVFEVGDAGGLSTFRAVIAALAMPGERVEARMRLVDLNGVAGASGAFTFVAQPVPEPGSLALFGAGGAGLLGAYLRRRHQSSPLPA